ncbi:MAG: hypothetical protein LBQ93_11355 [Treponema sp.]|jgi:hypothetical protein|nr:hypothetical protein [Treponema sp.]
MLKIKTRQDKTASILIVIAVILAFGLIGCSDGDGGDGWKAVGHESVATGIRSEADIYTLSGTEFFGGGSYNVTKSTDGGNNGIWTGTYNGQPLKLTIDGNSWEAEVNNGAGGKSKGTFTVSGNNFTFTMTHYWG